MELGLVLARFVRGMRQEQQKNALSPPGFYFVRALNVRVNRRSVDTLEKSDTVMVRL